MRVKTLASSVQEEIGGVPDRLDLVSLCQRLSRGAVHVKPAPTTWTATVAQELTLSSSSTEDR